MFEKEIQFNPAWDKRHDDPEKDYGIGSATMYWILKGDKGAITFNCALGWYLPHVEAEHGDVDCFKRMAYDIGYHSPKPMYEGQKPMKGHCAVIGCECYYDGSTLNAEPYLEALIAEGGKMVWKMMEQEYERRFNDSEQ